MKKTILIALFFIISCSSNEDYIEVVKVDLRAMNLAESEINMLSFKTFEASPDDVFDFELKKLNKNYKMLVEVSNFNAASSIQKQIDSLIDNRKKLSNEKFTKVIAFKTNPDTVFKSIYFIDSKKNIISKNRY